jgi:hypothetical protein
MTNPWNRRPLKKKLSAPVAGREWGYVFPDDELDMQRRGKLEEFRFDFVPIPFHGNPEKASVLFLMTNPNPVGYEETPRLARARLRALRFEAYRPFVSLDPDFDKETGSYWTQKVFGKLIEDGIERETLMHHVAVVQFFPYWWETGVNTWLGLPSQEYSFDLVDRAIKSGKLVVVNRRTHWVNAIERLPMLEEGKADNVVWKLARKRSVRVSPKNLGEDAYNRVKAALAEKQPR